MSRFYELLKTNKIYESNELRDFILGLESRYEVVNSFEHYNSLVNFSKNKNAPVHEWFKYREGFAGVLIDELIDDSNLQKDDMVVDPFVGSGTTLVSSVSKGFDAIGIDVNPMSAVISKVKSTSYLDEDLNRVSEFLNELPSLVKNQDEPIVEPVSKYFPIENYKTLKKIYTLIERIKSSKEFDILFCGYLSIIEECSNRRRDGNGLKTVVTKIDDVLMYYVEKVNKIVMDIKSVSNNYKANSYVFAGSSSNMSSMIEQVKSLNGRQVGSIIFSPPYANSFDYFESYKLELILGGFVSGSKKIDDYRSTAVRSFIGGEKENSADYFVNILSKEIEDAIPAKEAETGKKDARTRKVPQMIKGYFTDMGKIVNECYKSLRKDGKCYIVIDQSSYIGKVVPSDLLVAYLAEKSGFNVLKIIECRTAKTSGQQISKFPYLREMLRESIIVLQK